MRTGGLCIIGCTQSPNPSVPGWSTVPNSCTEPTMTQPSTGPQKLRRCAAGADNDVTLHAVEGGHVTSGSTATCLVRRSMGAHAYQVVLCRINPRFISTCHVDAAALGSASPVRRTKAMGFARTYRRALFE